MTLPQHGLIIADDLTGALDSSVFFAERGWQVTVRDWRHISAGDRPWRAEPSLLAIDSDSRGISPDAAGARINALVAKLAPLPAGCLVFKKIDSRLKGNVEAETIALARILGRQSLMVCPAVPDAGRLVANGSLIDGETVAALPSWPRELAALCPDISNEADLDLAARGMLRRAASVIAVGARGLAKSLAEALPPVTRQHLDPAPTLALPIAFIIGTNDPVTLAQVAELHHVMGIRETLFPADQAARPPEAPGELLRLAVSSRDQFELQLVPFVRWAEQRAERIGAQTLVVSGGDTLRALAEARAWTGIKPLHSLGNGLVLSAQAGGGVPLIVSKSGGFGHLQALSELVATARSNSA